MCFTKTSQRVQETTTLLTGTQQQDNIAQRFHREGAHTCHQIVLPLRLHAPRSSPQLRNIGRAPPLRHTGQPGRGHRGLASRYTRHTVSQGGHGPHLHRTLRHSGAEFNKRTATDAAKAKLECWIWTTQSSWGYDGSVRACWRAGHERVATGWHGRGGTSGWEPGGPGVGAAEAKIRRPWRHGLPTAHSLALALLSAIVFPFWIWNGATGGALPCGRSPRNGFRVKPLMEVLSWILRAGLHLQSTEKGI